MIYVCLYLDADIRGSSHDLCTSTSTVCKLSARCVEYDSAMHSVSIALVEYDSAILYQ